MTKIFVPLTDVRALYPGDRVKTCLDGSRPTSRWFTGVIQEAHWNGELKILSIHRDDNHTGWWSYVDQSTINNIFIETNSEWD